MRNTLAQRSLKRIDPTLHVHVWTPAGFRLAGRLELEETGDRSVSAWFEYDRSYLEAAGDGLVFALDPLNLPLSSRRYASASPYVVLGAIFDAAPDAWGRRVASALAAPHEQGQVYRNAFVRGADGIGALILTPVAHPSIDDIVAESLAERPALSQLAAAARAARQLELHNEVEPALEGLLAGSWTIGGARPKAILRDDRPGASANASLIAKFRPSGDTAGRNELEWASLEMAADIGLPVPRHELVDVDDGRVLLLSRFDRGDGRGGGDPRARRHYVSAMSLVSAQPQSPFLDSRFDVATFSWDRLMQITSQVAPHPAQARVEMFARLLLNAGLQNTDDHLKNFGFLRCADDAQHYEIAPVFDVSPQAARTHYLHCGELGRHYSVSDVMPLARELFVAVKAAREVEERVRSVLSRCEDYFERAGLSERQIEAASALVRQGLGEPAEQPTPRRTRPRP